MSIWTRSFFAGLLEFASFMSIQTLLSIFAMREVGALNN
jgi:hypothetical protein